MTRIFVGSIKPIQQTGTPSGIYKEERREGVHLTAQGLEGDQQADLSVHGGVDKAVHCYPAEHYFELQQFFPEIAIDLVPGALGENLSYFNLDEKQVYLGEIWQVGEALLQITQPRQPCWKIDAKFGATGLTAFIAEQLLTGWYCRVVKEGMVTPDDSWVRTKESPCRYSLYETQLICRQHRPSLEDLAHICATPGLAITYRAKLQQRLDWLKSHSH